MKRWLLLLWLLLPLPMVVWHFGPGQKWLARDHAQALLRQAEQAERNGDWKNAEDHFREASGRIRTTEPRLTAQLDIALARMRYRQGGAVAAIDQIDRVIDDRGFRDQSPALQREARELAGRIHYHAAWVMRLEGAQRDLWMEEAELARQNFRLLSEDSLAAGRGSYSQLQQTNLESAVRLQRLSLTELMARRLPEEGQALVGQGLTEEMGRRRGRRGQRPGIGDNTDARDPANGAGNSRFPGGPGS